MKDKSVPAGQFKARCLKLMDEVNAKRTSVLITKRGKPIAKLVPVESESKHDEIFGCLKGKAKVKGDIVKPVFTLREWGNLA